MVWNGPNWSKIVKIVKNSQNGLKCTKMVQNGPKWSKLVKMVNGRRARRTKSRGPNRQRTKIVHWAWQCLWWQGGMGDYLWYNETRFDLDLSLTGIFERGFLTLEKFERGFLTLEKNTWLIQINHVSVRLTTKVSRTESVQLTSSQRKGFNTESFEDHSHSFRWDGKESLRGTLENVTSCWS